MDYELTITLRRSDPDLLAADFRALTEFLERRNEQRLAIHSIVRTAEDILQDSAR